MSKSMSRVGSIRAIQIAKARSNQWDDSLMDSNNDSGQHSLPDLYSHVVDRLENVLETDWSIIHDKQATCLEDEVLRLRLWGENSGLSSHDSFTVQGCMLRLNDEFASWTREQLLEIELVVEALAQDAAGDIEQLHDPKSANSLTRSLRCSVDTLIKRNSISLRRGSQPASHKSMDEEIGGYPESPSRAVSGRSPISPTTTYVSNGSPSHSTNISPFSDNGYLHSARTSITEPDIEASPRRVSNSGSERLDTMPTLRTKQKPSPEEYEGEDIGEVDDEPSKADARTANGITSICSSARTDLGRLEGLTRMLTQPSTSRRASEPKVPPMSGSESETLTQLNEDLGTLCTQLSQLLRYYQSPKSSLSSSPASSPPTSQQSQTDQNHQQRHLDILMHETALAKMIRAVSRSSRPIYATLNHSLGQKCTSGMFGEVVLYAFTMHISCATQTIQIALDSSRILDATTGPSEPITLPTPTSIDLLAAEKHRVQKLSAAFQNKSQELDTLVIDIWQPRLQRMKSSRARDEVEMDLAATRGSWEYGCLVCEWVVLQIEGLIEGGGVV